MSTITESIGRVLAGRYRIESALGSGASANVFAAFDTTLQRRVAVKVLHPALAADGGFLRRFRAEAQCRGLAGQRPRARRPRLGRGRPGTRSWCSSSWAGGRCGTCSTRGVRLSLSQAADVGAQAAEGLAYAHARGFVHRDVKPANLLFDEEGRLRVADFGLARALAEAALTEPAGTTVGTARYAAPEQALGHRVDGRADVYSLALVLYEAVTGVVPFTSDTTIVDAHGPGRRRLFPATTPWARWPTVLAEAATPEAEDRLDAAALRRPPARARRRAARSGEAPAGRRRRGRRRAAATGDPARRPRPHRARHGGCPRRRRPGAAPAAGEDPDVLAFATAVGITDAGPPPSAGTVAAGRGSPPSWSSSLALGGDGDRRGAQEDEAPHPQLQAPGHHRPLRRPGRRQAAPRPVPGHRRRPADLDHRARGPDPEPDAAAGAEAEAGERRCRSWCRRACPPSRPVARDGDRGLPGHHRAPGAVPFQDGVHRSQLDERGQGHRHRLEPQGHRPSTGRPSRSRCRRGRPIETIPSLAGQSCAGATTTLQAVGLARQLHQRSTTPTVPTRRGDLAGAPTGAALEGATVNIVISSGRNR